MSILRAGMPRQTSQQSLRKPDRLQQMPHWPLGGAQQAVKLAELGAKMGMSLGVTFADHSSMTLTWELQRDLEVTTRWPEIYDKLGDPPYLVVLVLDNGVAIKDDKRVREHEAERRLAEIHKLMGGEGSKRLMGVIAASVDETDSRRKYFWKVY